MWVSPRLSLMESNDSIDGEGGMLGGGSQSGEAGRGVQEVYSCMHGCQMLVQWNLSKGMGFEHLKLSLPSR